MMDKKTYINEADMQRTVQQLTSTPLRDGDTEFCDLCVGSSLPSRQTIKEIVTLCRELLFPGFGGEAAVNSYNLEYTIGLQCEQLKNLLEHEIVSALSITARETPMSAHEVTAATVTARFISRLPALRDILLTDVNAIYLGDPAATSHEEVIFCYPSIKAIINYRVAHALQQADVPIIPRMISEMAHSETGIDIHPGATIGHHFAIDHGTGVVIGATAIIGDYVKIYQGVTLGALSFPLDADGHPIKGVPRHPIIGNNVIIYSNSTILGRITIGDDAVIGGNIWVTEDVPAGAKVVQRR